MSSIPPPPSESQGVPSQPISNQRNDAHAAPSPHGHPVTAPATTAPGTAPAASRVRLLWPLALAALVLAVLVTLLRVIGGAMTLSLMDDLGAGSTTPLIVAGILGTVALLLSIALLVVSILLIVLGRGGVRIGGIVIAADLLLTVLASIVVGIVASVAHDPDAGLGSSLRAASATATAELVIAVILGLVLIAGGVVAVRAARRLRRATPAV